MQQSLVHWSLVGVWQLAAEASSKPAFIKTFLAMVLRRFPFAEVGKIVGKSDNSTKQVDIMCFGERYDPHPHASPIFESWRIQVELSYQTPRFWVRRVKRSVGQCRNVVRMQQVERIAHGLIALDGIAAAAGVDQIEVVELSSGMDRLGLEMIEIEFARDLAPRFTFQAIDAAEAELVAKPRTVVFV